MKKGTVLVCVTACVLSACMSWMHNPPQSTTKTLYFVGASPSGLSVYDARDLARADVERQVAEYLGTEVGTSLKIHSGNYGTTFESEVKKQAAGLVGHIIWRKYYRDSKGVVYVLGSLEQVYASRALSSMENAIR
jgi:hypothetical protein